MFDLLIEVSGRRVMRISLLGTGSAFVKHLWAEVTLLEY